VATRLGGILGEPIYLPHAVEVDGEVITIYDPALHRRVEQEDDGAAADGAFSHDRRFVRVERPVLIAGGELQLEDLDLRFDPIGRVYRAPLQLKAMGGALVLDDFGRQRAAPAEILSRWILPLEYQVDYLTLHTGFKFQLPFDCLLVFASNGAPEEIGEEAFMRRIQYKVHLPDPSRDAYAEIFSREVARVGFACELPAVDWLYATWYDGRGITPRACHPRDLLRLVRDYARYEGREPRVSNDTLSFACGAYFAGREGTRGNGREGRA
jgi:predicted ATPase with chaperone activity